jgi:catechol 2,3-dioxygenase-like lactoylglutathione lyase family enzyme
MALHALLDLELSVPDPDSLVAFWTGLGMERTDRTTLGTADRPSQLRLAESTYRHVSELRLACSDESDLVDIRDRLMGLGVDSTVGDGVLRCTDPLSDHDVVVEVADVPPVTTPSPRAVNRPGESARVNRRSSAAVRPTPAPPRRVGHVVFGCTDVAASVAFYRDGIGFKVSDTVDGGFGTFLRCSTDHHNMLLMPAPVPCMNHYAVEMDDVDAIGLAGMQVVSGQPESSVYGIGRHVLGANLFWYLLDPQGGMFELFADMDQITDDVLWTAEQYRDDWDPFTIASWEPGPSKPDFFLPADIVQLAEARAAAGR